MKRGDEGLVAVVSSLYEVECWRKGQLIWEERVHNLVTGGGATKLLDWAFKTGNPQTPQWFVGLVNAAGFSQFVFTDTLESHPGWTEDLAYSEAIRRPWVCAVPLNAYTDNQASRAQFTMTSAHTVQGGFLTDNQAKGSTSAGILYGEASFVTPRAVAVDDVLLVKLACQITST